MSRKNENKNSLQAAFDKNKDYFEMRIDALHRRASLHKDEMCGHRARAEITGMITVLNALGYEVKMDWNLWCAECEIIPEDFIVINQKLSARLDSREFQLEKEVKSLSAHNRILRSKLKQWEVE